MFEKYYKHWKLIAVLLIVIVAVNYAKVCGAANFSNNTVESAEAQKIKVFLLAGQSNMDGRGDGSKLTDQEKEKLVEAQKNIQLAYNWNPVKPLDITIPKPYIREKFKLEKVFGPELFFGLGLAESMPDEKILLIKRSIGGTSLYGCWNPNWTEEKAALMNEANSPKLYSDFVNYINEVLSDYKEDEYEFCGMLWVQGETDSNVSKFGPLPSESYGQNLQNLIREIRKDTKVDDLPFMMLQVGSGKVVEGMQEAAGTMENVTLIQQSKDPDSPLYLPGYGPPTGHYNYEGMKKIGIRFKDVYLNEYTHVSKQSDSPNILLIQVDDMGYDDLSVHGNTVSNTPNLDAFSESAVRFGNFMVNSVCAPTRASLLTGRDFWRTGVSAMHGGNDYLHLDETTFANIFQDNGYVTGMWGKWHSGKSDGYWHWDRGFDEGYYANLYQYFPSNGWLNEYPHKTTHHGEWSPKVLVDYTMDFIDRNKEQPFLAYLSFLTCHGIWDTPDEYKNKYVQEGRSEEFATLLGMLEFMDDETGRLLDYLTENGLDENTVVLFLSDNGPIQMKETNAEWALRNNHGFLGNKARLWQNGLKSPLFIRWNGKYEPSDIDRLVAVTDIFPTILDIAGIPLPAGNLPLDGRSIKPYLEGDTTTLEEKSAVFSHWFPVWEEGQFSPLQPNEKAALEFDQQRITLINERYKLLHNPVNVGGSPAKIEEKVLIDLQEDPMERTNVAAENPAIVHSMMDELQNWFAEIKNEPHSFSPPVFQIAWKGKKSSEVRGYGPSKTIGCENDSQQLKGLNAEGDYAEYKINVHHPGVYKIFVSTTNTNMAGMTLEVSCAGSKTESALQNKGFQEIGLIPLDAGEHTFKLEVVKIETGKSPEIKELKAIQFDLDSKPLGLSDSLATKETIMLFTNLKKIGKKGIIFGQHLACYEVQNWRDDELSTDLRSDCYTSTGDHPGVFGFDFGRGIEKFKNYCEEIYKRGGIITYSWHAKNPVTGGNYNDTSGSPVTAILSGGETRKEWFTELDKIADYINNLEVDSVKVPVIFRPFHENTGSWFWWGSGNCTNQEYIDLWRLTIDYLRVEKGVHNMLVAYSPSKPSINEELTYSMYPGDEYVDIIGFDAYQRDEELKSLILNSSRFVCEWAQEKYKVPAITELGIRKGIQNSTNPDWFNSGFYDLIKDDPVAKNVAYALTWMNTSPDSYWVPLPEQPTYDGFIEFYKDSTTFFLNDIKDIYGENFSLSEDSAITPKLEKAMLKLQNVNGSWVWKNQDGINISTAGFNAEEGNIIADTTSDNGLLISSVYTGVNNVFKIAGEYGIELPQTAFIGSSNSNPLLRIIFKTNEQVQTILSTKIMFDEAEIILNKTIVLNATETWDTITVELKTIQNYEQFAGRLNLKYLKILYPTTASNRLNLEIKEIAYGANDLVKSDDALTGINLFVNNNGEIFKI
ncbi:MAG TPA: sulfatase-like hydrolase/transferase, partial [Prolixibacteraceae bacterium]|nr:sulfatase-like hydrolase/transferase [Prolixibacteraceae bacterium]